QQQARAGRRSDGKAGRAERAARGERDEQRLAALSLPRGEQIVARTAQKNGRRRFVATALSNSEEPGGENRRKITNRRHYWDCFARRTIVWDVARGPGAPDKRRRFAFHAC